MNVGEWVTVWERELTSLPPFRPITRRTNGRTDGHTRFSAETLNPDTPKRIPITLSDTLTLRDTLTLSDTHYGHTQEDTHYTEWYPDIQGYLDTEWYPLRTHPRGYPLRTHPRGYPLHWVIPTPWVIFPVTDSSQNPPKSSPITVYTEGPCFPHKRTGHWVIPMTLRDTPDTEWYPSPWVSSQ
jgi:hypothetical protein